ncbi:MAG: hypothetical protein L5655_05675 [Thermosediminibacteraceae bacterium]|nr:hypothetical protein [Thermosediminibacteraceae bacterium]
MGHLRFRAYALAEVPSCRSGIENDNNPGLRPGKLSPHGPGYYNIPARASGKGSASPR